MTSPSEALQAPSETDWEQELAELLSMLSATQQDLLAQLAEKRKLLAASDTQGLQALQGREQELVGRLQACQQRRAALLEQAAQQGLPADSLQALSRTLPKQQRAELEPRFEEAQNRSRLLQHQSLTNWVVIQRTLLHLSQLLEIIATGGQPQPTYGKEQGGGASGSLVDQAG